MTSKIINMARRRAKRAKSNSTFEFPPPWNGRCAKIIILIFGLVGIFCSSKVILSCDLFSIYTLNDHQKVRNTVPSPFDDTVFATVGLFRYEILERYDDTNDMVTLAPTTMVENSGQRRVQKNSTKDTTTTELEQPQQPQLDSHDGGDDFALGGDDDYTVEKSTYRRKKVCRSYEHGIDHFSPQMYPSHGSRSFHTSQWMSMMACFLGLVSWIWTLSEASFCYHSMSYLPVTVLYVLTSTLQFCIVPIMYNGNGSICQLDDNLTCESGPGMMASILAAILYLVCAILECTSPIARPIRHGSPASEESSTEVNDQRKKLKDADRGTASGRSIVGGGRLANPPANYNDDYDDDYFDDEGASSSPHHFTIDDDDDDLLAETTTPREEWN